MERDVEVLQAHVRAWWAAMMLRDCHGAPDDDYLAQREYALARDAVRLAGMEPSGACGWPRERVQGVLDDAMAIIRTTERT